MELKLILKRPILPSQIKRLNIIADKLGYDSTFTLWLRIQHLNILFGDNLTASYDEKSEIIDFHDEDGTLIFYVSN